MSNLNVRLPFNGVENVTKNYSQAGQDLFVLMALNGKRNGVYLDIGAGYASFGSNTFLLETEFGWKGASVDLNPSFFAEHKANRKHHIELVDGTKVDYAQLLIRGGIQSNIIDYVSLDLDGDATLNALYNLPFNTHKIAVITYEHDAYVYGDKYKKPSGDFLRQKGFELIASNISCEGYGMFEDWWINPELVDRATIDRLKVVGDSAKEWSSYVFKRKATFHVITPMNRPENISPMAEMLKERRTTHKLQWHVITDQSSTKKFEFPEYDWVHHHVCPEHEPKFVNFWDRCNWAMNWFLDTHPISSTDLYCFLNDDDAVEPEYFEKIYNVMEHYNWEQKVVIPSMERGHRIPSYAQEPRRHPPDKLWASAENIKIGGVGLEQIVATGEVVRNQRFEYHVCGDGLYIIEAVRRHGAIICPTASVWFNYFEPERWDK